jgi:ER membrane protein complex subunit 1
MITTTGAVQLWQQDKVQWTREESLASISVAEFVELPEKKVTSSHAGEGQETLVARLKWQLLEAQVGLMLNLEMRIMYSSLGLP